MSGAGEARPMSKTHKDLIRKNYEVLVQNMDPGSVLSILYSRFHISESQHEEISAKRTRAEKNRELLGSITRAQDAVFAAFRVSLAESEQLHLANLLREDVPNVGASRDREPLVRQPESETGGGHFPKGTSFPVQESALPESHKPYPMETAASADRAPVSIPFCLLHWTQFNEEENMGGVDSVHVYPSTPKYFQAIKQQVLSKEVYDTTKARKGKACILSVPTFAVPWLRPLPGYETDLRRLASLWHGIGFDVWTAAPHVAQGAGSRSLTELELREAVKQFAGGLKDEDQAAVLCVLSHGGRGFVYGSDGHQLPVDEIIKYVDNKHCPQMAGKPRIVVIQACQGDEFDPGVTIPTGMEIGTGLIVSPKIPTTNDMIICYPTMPGKVCFIDNNMGSVYLQTFIREFAESCGKLEISHLLTKVNGILCGQGGINYQEENPSNTASQAPNFSNSLTKLLQLLPSNGGKDGSDWCLT